MRQALRITAVFALIVTLAAAGVFAYGVKTMTPVVEQVCVTATPAEQAQETFDMAMAQAAQQTFTGRRYSETEGLSAQDCTFLTYTVRLKNSGFFPAEWIALTVRPREEYEAGRDVLALPDNGAYVLTAGCRGDLSATILTTGSAEDTQRMLEVSCYVFGRKVAFELGAQ